MAKGQELIDISGNTYGFLKVICFSHIGNRRRSFWKCECLRCGKIVTLRKNSFAYPYSIVRLNLVAVGIQKKVELEKNQIEIKKLEGLNRNKHK